MTNLTVPVSIEEFAAYLDGNLPEAEMERISGLIASNDMLSRMIDASTEIDHIISDYTDSDLRLPMEITDPVFELPAIDESGLSPLVALTPEPLEFGCIAADIMPEISEELSADFGNDNEDSLNTDIPDTFPEEIQ